METIVKEYPKAIASLCVGIAVTYLTGKIPEGFLSPSIIEAAQVVIAAGTTILLGRFTRLTKSEATVINKINNAN